ncbi:hypothetical protein GCM10008110_26780 [Marinobacter persicus]|nr:hypothetical protein GCM10008110_26780 [Marinobacter persicus]
MQGDGLGLIGFKYRIATGQHFGEIKCTHVQVHKPLRSCAGTAERQGLSSQLIALLHVYTADSAAHRWSRQTAKQNKGGQELADQAFVHGVIR